MATSQITIQTLLGLLETQLEALTWTPSGNTGPTSFSEVNTFEKFSGAIGSPWCNLLDEPAEIIKKAMGGLTYEKRTPIGIYICTDHAEIGEEEAVKRMRYAYEAVETLITTKSTMDAIAAPGYSYLGWENISIDQATVRIRKLTLQVQSKI